MGGAGKHPQPQGHRGKILTDETRASHRPDRVQVHGPRPQQCLEKSRPVLRRGPAAGAAGRLRQAPGLAVGVCLPVGLAADGDRLEKGRQQPARRCRRHRPAPAPAPRDRTGSRKGGKAHLLRKAPGHEQPAGRGDAAGLRAEQSRPLPQPQLPAHPRDRFRPQTHRGRQTRSDFPLALRLPAGLDR